MSCSHIEHRQLLSKETLQESQVSQIQIWNPCFALGLSAYEILYAHSKIGVSIPQVLWNICAKALMAFNAKFSVDSTSQYQNPRLENLT